MSEDCGEAKGHRNSLLILIIKQTLLKAEQNSDLEPRNPSKVRETISGGDDIVAAASGNHFLWSAMRCFVWNWFVAEKTAPVTGRRQGMSMSNRTYWLENDGCAFERTGAPLEGAYRQRCKSETHETKGLKAGEWRQGSDVGGDRIFGCEVRSAERPLQSRIRPMGYLSRALVARYQPHKAKNWMRTQGLSENDKLEI